jgi:hypothetical protein
LGFTVTFFIRGYGYNGAVIRERAGFKPKEYFRNLISFIRENVPQKIINEDLNSLLPNKQFQQVRKIFIPETLYLLAQALDKC